MSVQNRLFGLEPIDLEENKQCDYCYAWVSSTQFDKDPTKPDELDHRCKACKKVEGLVRKYGKYGLTSETYSNMLWEQGGNCAICARTEKAVVVDHCHIAGQVRGLLCGKCNSGLGFFEDNPKRLLAAIAYLKNAMQKNAKTGSV